MAQEQTPKWGATVSFKLSKASANQIWPLFTDFFNLNRWLPTLSICHGVRGTNGEPGCVRFCAGSSIRSLNAAASWSTELLTAVDHVNRTMSYEMVDSNIGFRSYVATVRVSPGDGDGGSGCLIEWWFSVEPVEGWALEDLVRMYERALEVIATRMEESVVDARRNTEKIAPVGGGC